MNMTCKAKYKKNTLCDSGTSVSGASGNPLYLFVWYTPMCYMVLGPFSKQTCDSAPNN